MSTRTPAPRVSDVRAALRWGAWALGGVTLLLLYRSAALDTATRYGQPGLQRAAYLVSLGAWATTLALLADGPVRRRTRLRRSTAGVLLVLTLAATAAATLDLPPGQQPTSTSWAVATNGWVLLAICPGTRVGLMLVGLAGPQALALAATVAGGVAQTVPMSARVLGILGLQVPVALAATALDRSAGAATALRLREEAIRTGRVVADTLHDDRLRRSRAIAAVAEPVLTALADPAVGTAPDEALRQRCGVAAAQVRRLLAGWHHDGPDPLGEDLAACLDQIQTAGTPVDVAVHAGSPLPVPLRHAACAVLRALAHGPGTRLRVTAVSTASQVFLSVVARGPAAGDGDLVRRLSAVGPVAVRVTTADNRVWVELTCPS